MTVDHIGYAVRDLDKAREVFETLGYVFEPVVEDKDRNLLIQFGNNAGTRVELLQTMDAEKESPVTGVLKKNGPTPYHICYKTHDLRKEIESLKKQKWVVIHAPERAVAFDSEGMVNVAFLLHRHIGMIELVEE